jgi:hypothetical protein
MKHILTIALCIIFSNVIVAQSEKYVNAMKKNVAEVETAMEKGTLPDLAASFERIADAEKNQWLPYYYAAYCNVMLAFTEQDKSKTDGIADKAEQLVTKAEDLAGGENSETCVIKSMIATAHMMVDPQSRYMQYGQASAMQLIKSKSLDPTNPRPVYLEAQTKFHTPEQFGGGKAQAKPLFAKALEMYDKFKPASELHPTWGKGATAYFLAQCN